jgi:hypothetical protein
MIGRVERGELGRIPYEALEAIATALDGRLELDFRWRGESLERLIDEVHAGLVGEVVRLFRDAGWDPHVEVSFSVFGERGSIDVFACHPAARRVAVVEVKGSVPEAGNTVIGVDRKSRLAPTIARERGWACEGVGRFLVVLDNSTSRDRIARHADVFRTAFPALGRDCLAWIRDPTGPPPSGILFIAPPASRRRSSPASRNARGVNTTGQGTRSRPVGRGVPRTRPEPADA